LRRADGIARGPGREEVSAGPLAAWQGGRRLGGERVTASGATRWVQLAAGVLGMVAVANFQYSWTLFVDPLQARHNWSRVEILDALNVFFILAQTWLVPFEGYLADRFGPRRLVLLGGALAALAWVLISATSSLPVLYAAQVLAGCGSGIVYAISIGNALKWF